MSTSQPNQERVLPARWSDSAADREHPSRFSHPRCTRGVREDGSGAQRPVRVAGMPEMIGRQWKPAGRPQRAGSCRAVIQRAWLFNAAYCSPQFFLSLQDKCDHCAVCFTSLPQQHSIHHRVLLGGRIRLCRYNNSIRHRRAGVGKQRFVNDWGSLAAQIPPISLTGNTSVPSSPGAEQPEEPDPPPPRWRGPCHPVVFQPGCTSELMSLTAWPLPVKTLRAAGAPSLGGAGTPAVVPQP